MTAEPGGALGAPSTTESAARGPTPPPGRPPGARSSGKPPLVPPEFIERYGPPRRVARYRGDDPGDHATPEMDARDPHASLRIVREPDALVVEIESFEHAADALRSLESGDGFTVEREGRKARLRVEREEPLARAAAHALAQVMVVLDRWRGSEASLLEALRPHLEAGFYVNDVYWRGRSATAYASRAPLRRELGGPREARTECFEIWLEAGHWHVTGVYTVPRWWVRLLGHTAAMAAPRRVFTYIGLAVAAIAGFMIAGAALGLNAPHVTLPVLVIALGGSPFLLVNAWKRGALSPAGFVPAAERLDRGGSP